MGKLLFLPQNPNMGETMQYPCITFAYKNLKANCLSTLDVTDEAKLFLIQCRVESVELRVSC